MNLGLGLIESVEKIKEKLQRTGETHSHEQRIQKLVDINPQSG
jgi:hypothetical protein